MHLNEWPLTECTLENIRAKWGLGEYRTHWFIVDLEAPDPSDRRSSGGNGQIFRLDEAEEYDEPVPPPAAPAFMQAADPMGSAFGFAKDLMTLADSRTKATLEAMHMGGGASGNAELLARFAALEAKMQADAERRLVEDAHRAALAVKDAEIADLKRAAERAELEADRADKEPRQLFEPGTPLLEQVPTIGANLIAGLFEKNPEAAMGIAGKVYEMYQSFKGKDAPPPPAPVVAPALAPVRAPFAPPVMHVVPAPRREPDHLTPSQTAKAADPAPPASAESSEGRRLDTAAT